MKARWSILILPATALLLVGCRVQQAEPAGVRYTIPGLEARVSTNRVHVGDAVKLELQVRHADGATVDWPSLGDGKRIVVGDQQTTRLDSTTSVARWTLMSYELGAHTVWSGTVTVVESDGARAARDLPLVQLNVESILPAAGEQLRTDERLARWPRAPLTRALLVIGLIGLLALTVGLLMRWWLARRVRPESRAPEPPAHEKALRALADLEQRTDFTQADPEAFFVELSAIVRRYLEDRFELRAPEQTTEEFIRSAAGSRQLQLEHQQLVAGFLEESDLVKFARHRPGAERMRQALAAAYRLVRETVPAPAPAPAEVRP